MNEKIGQGLNKVLDRHGYCFQYSTLAHIEELMKQRAFKWKFEAAEFPVEVTGKSTHIDYILTNNKKRIYLVAECKRANPAYVNWCFVRAPFVRRNKSMGDLLVEEVFVNEATNSVQTKINTWGHPNEYGIGLELKTGEKGDYTGAARDGINSAVTQVCRGLNGLIEFLKEHQKLIGTGRGISIVPVIITTARIWTSEVDVGKADIETGNISSADLDPIEKSWIWYRYHQSPDIKHTVPLHNVGDELHDYLDPMYARSIAVVNSKGIKDFLSLNYW